MYYGILIFRDYDVTFVHALWVNNINHLIKGARYVIYATRYRGPRSRLCHIMPKILPIMLFSNAA